MSFVHLHVHSQYSLLEATCLPEKLAKFAKAQGMPAIAMTDNGNMFGALEFYFACQKEGVKPIIGIDVYLAPKGRLVKGEDRDTLQMPNTRLVLLAQNYEGYKNLCALSTIGYKEGFYYKPRIDYEVLKQYSENIICLSGGFRGEVPFWFREKGEDVALEKIQKLKDIFGDRFYLELNKTGVQGWDETNAFFVKAGELLGVELVAANDVHYMNREDQLAQEVLICVGSNKTIHDPSRFRLGSDQFYLKTAEEMKILFKEFPKAIENTINIANRCNITFKLKDEKGKTIYHLPSYPTKDGSSLTSEMEKLTASGLLDRLKEAELRGETVPAEEIPKYHERLKYEISVIEKMGFLGYFLIVQDFINWAKTNNIPVGPGRGSGAGSLVAYCLKITDLDPVRYGLIFERFLNPERISMPDFDIDFCQDRRGEVIKYVTDKYSADSVSQIITYGKLQARAAIRDVGRVLGMTFSEVDVVAKLIPDKLGINLQEALDMEPRLRELREVDPQINSLLDIALKVEGLVRHAGIHAAGVIIADGRLLDYAPLYRGTEGENVVQYDMKHAEKIGLIKFDFLGLTTLTHIQNALNLVEKNRGKLIKPQEIPISDPEIYKLMSSGDSSGIFQFEGEGITDALKKIKPTCFEDIMAINALYRPGPMDMIPDYTKRKHGEAPVEYLFPQLETVLKETYGVIIYQEQVQLIAANIASYSLGEADLLRRAMGKKIAEEMNQQRARFLDGAKKNGYDEEKSAKLFDLMAEFANYGFNKSHSAAYCVIAAQTGWIKHYYPLEFYAALLSTVMSDTDKVVKYIKVCSRKGIEIRPPHINHSDYMFTVKGDVLYYSLGAIKGVGQAAVEAILEARNSLPNKEFSSLNEFFEKVDLRRANKKVLECLIKAGALDGFGYHRAQLFKHFDKWIDLSESKRRDEEIGQTSLFSMDAESEEKMEVPSETPWSRLAQLTFEREVLGFYLSDHPLHGMENFCDLVTDTNIAGLKDFPHKKKITLAGLISTHKELITKKGTRMAFAQLEDLSGMVELIVFPDTFAQTESLIKGDQPIMVQGTLEKENDSQKIIVESIQLLNNQFNKTKKVVFEIDDSLFSSLDNLKKFIDLSPGNVAVSFDIDLKSVSKKVTLDLKDQGITLNADFIENIQQNFGKTDFVKLRI